MRRPNLIPRILLLAVIFSLVFVALPAAAKPVWKEGDAIAKLNGEPPVLAQDYTIEFLTPDTVLVHSNTKSTEQLVQELQRLNFVAYAEPNYQVTTELVPNDPDYGLLWGMEKISAPAAWDTTTSSGNAVVAVIDTGIDYTHEDLVDNVWTAPQDFTVTIGGVPLTCPAGSHGYNAILGTCDPKDDHYHGSHCSGTVGATGDNSVGVAGVNWHTKIMGVKFLGSSGSGWTSDAVKGLEFIIQVKQQGLADVRVTSNSWGGGGYSQALHDQINKAGDNGMIFVAAAGNSGRDADLNPMYPAAYDCASIISVAATDSADQKATFSNYGLTTVDIGAPGVQVYSTRPLNTYGYLSGTSMATPHAAGAAGLVLSVCPDLDPTGLKMAILNTVDPIPALQGITVTGGRLNVAQAVAKCGDIPPVPPTPTPTVPPTPPPTATPTPDPRPIVSFTIEPRTGHAPLDVQFTDTSGNGPITQWLWDFGDGISSTEQNPTHQYTEKGVYRVTLVAWNQYGYAFHSVPNGVHIVQGKGPKK